MKPSIDKFAEVVRRVEAERGPFTLFGLFRREDTPDVWDVVASAPWLDEASLDSFQFLADQIGAVLQPAEMMALSRIVPMETNNLDIGWLASVAAKALPTEFSGSFAGAEIKEGAIVAASASD